MTPARASLTPDFISGQRSKVRALLGDTWKEIKEVDNRAQVASPLQPRHLLALLEEHAGFCESDLEAGRLSEFLPDALAFTIVATVLERAQSDRRTRSLLPELVTQNGFRHNILTLGFADHARRAGWPISLPPKSPDGMKMHDLDVGGSQEPVIEIEAKTADEFDGPVRSPTPEESEVAIRRAWKKGLRGGRRQLTGARPGLMLIGGVTLAVRSVPTIVHVAERFLWRVGRSRPNFIGFVVMTFWTSTRDLHRDDQGGTVRIRATLHGTTYLDLAANPHYTGPTKLNFVAGEEDWMLDRILGDRGHPRL